jgi:serine/threonine protein kinase
MPELEVREMFKQLLSAFALLEMNQVVHRDLKLDNFVLHFPNLSEE